MRGRRNPQITMLAFVHMEDRGPPDHPLRRVKRLADEALVGLSSTFDAMYAVGGRPSIPPERLRKASLLIAQYSVRSERAFCKELEDNLLFRWFLDMDLLEPSFAPRFSPRTARGCLSTKWVSSCSTRSSPKRTKAACSRMSTSLSTAHSSRPHWPQELQAHGRRAAQGD